ncbi:histidine phosphotransferase family protein [Elioraea sp.]|uniref:histidine phosphotransferase family protein n=1 Tax=Elioraea sp. TaxID=2185103 RepID=UPI003F6F174C
MFAELVCSRLTHDLSGPLATISGAVELLSLDDPASRQEAMELAGEATAQLAHRLKYLRAAWGAGGQELTVAAIAAMADGVLAGGRATLDAARVAGPDRPLGALGRVLLNALMVAAEALPRGGTIVCAGDPETQLVLKPVGDGAAWPGGLAGLIAGDDPLAAATAAGPRGIAAPMLMALARRDSVAVTLLMGSGLPLLSLAPERRAPPE